jgi:hypothetical protein
MPVFCKHTIKLLTFLNEVNEHGCLSIENQTVYNCYEKKRDFLNKLDELEQMQFITIQRNNGHAKIIKLDIAGELFLHYMNLILKDFRDRYELKN